jgi:signal transduction histidine kinase/CheY-like chemotaxis protein
MQINRSKTFIATGIVTIGVILLSLLILWKYSIDAADKHLHEVEELRQATALVDKMRQIALHRTSLLNDMRSSNDPFELDELNQQRALLAGDFMVTRDKLLNLDLSPEVRVIWNETVPAINRTGQAQTKTAVLFLENKRKEAEHVMLSEALPFQSAGQAGLSKMLAAQQVNSEQAMIQASENKKTTYVTIYSIGTFALLLTLSIMVLVVRMAKQTQKDLDYASEATLANKMKSDFLATMSHEIRTPLAAIIGYAEASLDSDQDMGERLLGTQRIIHNGKHLLGLINDILDLSKIESGKLELEQLAISPVEIANEAYNIVKIKAEEKQLKCEINYAFPLPENIIGDSTRIKQILINLLSNAIKFTEKGHVLLKISSSPYDENICFEVEDTGIGITEEQKSKIFNAFIQADTSTTRKYGGTGLGLALTKDLVEQMDGELTINSKSGVGSRFTITLGIGKPSNKNLLYELDQTNIPHPKGIKTEQERFQLQGNVLLVEDNEDNQRLLSSFIRKTGADVTVANNGVEALELFPNKQFDMIFMDMQMPIMDGPTTTEKLRNQGCEIPIIALTANAYKEDKERCFSAGCNDFATKPVTHDRLYKILSKYLDVAEEQQQISPIMSTLIEKEPDYIDLVQAFIKKLPHSLAVIKEAVLSENWSELKSCVHDLKGVGASIGYPQISDIAGQVEFQMLNHNVDKIDGLIGQLELLTERIIVGHEVQSAKINAVN